MAVPAWIVITVALLVWNVIYCALRIAKDFRGDSPASGVWGLFALAGTVSALALVGLSVVSAAFGSG